MRPEAVVHFSITGSPRVFSCLRHEIVGVLESEKSTEDRPCCYIWVRHTGCNFEVDGTYDEICFLAWGPDVA